MIIYLVLILRSALYSLKGVLRGYDQRSDIVLSESVERVYNIDDGVEQVPLGLYLVKGDQM